MDRSAPPTPLPPAASTLAVMQILLLARGEGLRPPPNPPLFFRRACRKKTSGHYYVCNEEGYADLVVCKWGGGGCRKPPRYCKGVHANCTPHPRLPYRTSCYHYVCIGGVMRIILFANGGGLPPPQPPR